MKILQVLPEMHSGGVERGTLELASYLVAHGHEAVVVSHGGRMVAALEKAGVRHIQMPVHRKRLTSLFQVGPFRRLLLREQPDILHVRSRVPAWIAWLAWRRLEPLRRPRFVTTFHGFYSVNRYSQIMTYGERVIAVSESIRTHVLEAYPQTAAETLRVVPRGIDPAKYAWDFVPEQAWLVAWQQQMAHLAGKLVLLLPGRITRLKGHEEFFQLLWQLKQHGLPVHGLVVGDTHPKKRAYLGELHRRVTTLGLAEDVSFLGHRHDVREIMTQCHVVCALSRQPESFGRTVLEALALGRPVLGYDIGGVGELLAAFYPQGRVPFADLDALVMAAQTILERPGKPTPVGPPFTLEAMCAGTVEIYRALLSEKSS